MSEEAVLEVLRKEKDAAALYIAKKLDITLIEAMKVLNSLIEQGKVEKKSKKYRLKE
jgi:DNA-binding IclR family transcriptional regulator